MTFKAAEHTGQAISCLIARSKTTQPQENTFDFYERQIKIM